MALLTAVVSLVPASVASAQTPVNEYTVVSGDYLSKIAASHGTTWQNIFNKNPDIKDPNLIFVGEKLILPSQGESVPQRTAPEASASPVAAPSPQPVQTPAPAPQPAPAPATQAVANLSGCDLARSLINQYSWNTDVAYGVMMKESSCNSNAVNWNDNHGSCMGSFGLFQISCENGQIYDPAANVAQAFAMYQARGWQPWGATTCSVKMVCY